MHQSYIKAMCIWQAMFAWAYATLGERMGSASLEALAAQAQMQLPLFNAQNLANMMWAFAKLSYTPDKELLQSCEAHAVRIVGAFKPQALVRCCLLQFSSKALAGSCFFVRIRNSDTIFMLIYAHWS